MSIRQESAYSTGEIPLTDLQIMTKEAIEKYNHILIFASIDYIIIILIFLYESNFFNSNENNITLFLIKFISLTLFYIFIIISLLLLNYILAKIIKYIYIIFALIFYLIEIIINLKNLIKNYSFLGVVFLWIIFLGIVPRLIIFYYIRMIIIKISEIEDIKKGEEHEKFQEKLENKMQRVDTNWSSKNSFDMERKKQSNINKAFSINDNDIKEEEKDNEDN